MEKALIQGERVEIRGFGSFKIKNYEGYQGRNPKTGEIINVASKKLPVFQGRQGTEGSRQYLSDRLATLVVLDGELAVPYNPKSAYAGSKVLSEDP